MIALTDGAITIPVLAILVLASVFIYFAYRSYLATVTGNFSRMEHGAQQLRTLKALAGVIGARDQAADGHVRRVQVYARALACAAGLKEEGSLKDVETAAMLYDIGKLAVPKVVLNKPGKLSPAEFQKVKVHSEVAAEILGSLDLPGTLTRYVRHHHEHWDGSGYPDGLAGNQTPLGARILAIADSYEALTCDRPYRSKYSGRDALEILRSLAGRCYDPEAVQKSARLLPDLNEQPASLSDQPGSTRGLETIVNNARSVGHRFPTGLGGV